VRMQRDRAISFFGAYAVYGENESDLLRTLEAHEILITSDEDLLHELNRVPKIMAPELEKIEAPEVRKAIQKISTATMDDVAALRRQARQQLERVLPGGPGDVKLPEKGEP